MTRFVRLFRYDPIKDPTARLRFEYDPDWGNAVLSDEDVHAEQAENPDARHVVARATIDLTTRELRWIAIVATELAGWMEREDALAQAEVDRLNRETEARAVVAATHGVPLSAVHVMRAEPEISTAALDRHLQNMAPVIEAINEGMEATGNGPRCPHGNMPREAGAGAGHWRDWHRGHGCHLDPDRGAKP